MERALLSCKHIGIINKAKKKRFGVTVTQLAHDQ
jgi:hypothetical protein